LWADRIGLSDRFWNPGTSPGTALTKEGGLNAFLYPFRAARGENRFNTNLQTSVWSCGADGSWVALYGNSCMVVKQPFALGNDNANELYIQRIIAATVSASKEIPIKERLHFPVRWDFQNPFKSYNWGYPSTQLNVATSAASTTSKGFGTAQGGEATTAAYGGVPLMNITLALKW